MDKEKELKELEKKAEEYLNGWKRAQADLINYKKDEDGRMKLLQIWTMNQIVLERILPVLDSFDQALAKDKDNEGLKVIQSQLESALEKLEVFRLEVAIGDTFDPSKHEALVSEESDQESETILEVVEAGYRYEEHVIRPAKVKISK